MTADSVAGRADTRAWALRLYHHTFVAGRLRRSVVRLLGRSVELRQLLPARAGQGQGRGLRAVPLAEIVGSEGRSGDFDTRFAPLHEHSRDRWVSVAVARRHGVSLPPVSLIGAADGYYVRDGHHRISVARALGEEFIEAEVL
jgi:hypothetical protein